MKALLLLSGGIDSPVAGYLMKQKNIEIIPIHFSLEPLVDSKTEEKSLKLAKLIGCKKFIVVYSAKQHSEIVKKCRHEYYYILTKRLMLKIAEKIAKKEKCNFIITGDNLAQVGSQTLSNLYVIDNATKMQVARPLLTNDKIETIAIARNISTLEISQGPEICCLLGPRHPATKSDLNTIEREESKLNLNKMINDSMKTTKVINI